MGQDSAIWYTVSQLARKLGVHRSTIYDWISKGNLDATKIGGSTRITMASIRRKLPALYESLLDYDANERGSRG